MDKFLLVLSFLKGVREAIPARISHAAIFAEFTRSLPQQNVTEWTIVVEAWEQNPALQNPFETTVPHKSSYL